MVTLRLGRSTAVIKEIFWLADMPPTRAVNTGALFTRPVFTGLVRTRPVDTGGKKRTRVYGPWTRFVNTARVNRSLVNSTQFQSDNMVSSSVTQKFKTVD